MMLKINDYCQKIAPQETVFKKNRIYSRTPIIRNNLDSDNRNFAKKHIKIKD